MLRTLALIALGYPDPRIAARAALNGSMVNYSGYRRLVDALVCEVDDTVVRTALAMIVLGWPNPEKIAKDALLGTVPSYDNALIQRLVDV